MKQTMKIVCAEGIRDYDVISTFQCNGRCFAVVGKKGFQLRVGFDYSVSDFLTGMAVCFGNDKKRIVADAKARLSTENAKKYDYSRHEIINTESSNQ